MISHKKYMEIALQLAEKGKGYVSPNPLVGCIIVKRGKIVGDKPLTEEYLKKNANLDFDNLAKELVESNIKKLNKY